MKNVFVYLIVLVSLDLYASTTQINCRFGNQYLTIFNYSGHAFTKTPNSFNAKFTIANSSIENVTAVATSFGISSIDPANHHSYNFNIQGNSRVTGLSIFVCKNKTPSDFPAKALIHSSVVPGECTVVNLKEVNGYKCP